MLGVDTAQFSAEIDFDGAVLAQQFIAKYNLTDLLTNLKDEKALEDLLVRYGQDVVKFMGSHSWRVRRTCGSFCVELAHTKTSSCCSCASHWTHRF